MTKSLTINRRPPEHRSKDFWFLREKGLEYIQQLGGKIWTDHNFSDPGITILEVLCYAITEIGSVAQQPIHQLLNINADDEDWEKYFYHPQDILGNCPLAINDYRKLLIDIKLSDKFNSKKIGVKNAFLYPTNEAEIPFYVRVDEDGKPHHLTYQDTDISNFTDSFGTVRNLNTKPIPLNGLYNVQLEFEPAELNNPIIKPEPEIQEYVVFPLWSELDDFQLWANPKYGVKEIKAGSIELINENYYKAQLKIDLTNTSKSLSIDVEIGTVKPINDGMLTGFIEETLAPYKKQQESIGILLEAVKERLYAHRNLGEDFVRFTGVPKQDIALCGEIVLQPDADTNKILADIFHQIDMFFSPRIPIRSLQEMLNEGKTLDEIYEGPTLKHGFIKDEDLKNKQRKNAVFTSDLINIIMDVEGVVAIHNFSISSYWKNHTLAEGETQCIGLIANQLRPRLDITHSMDCLKMSKGNFVGVTFTRATVKHCFDELSEAPDYPTAEVPEHPTINIKGEQPYHSIQHDFPGTYGIGIDGLNSTVPEARKAQAKQLKAYLLFYEQLLSNFLRQVLELRQYFSISPPSQSTNFFAPLYNVPNVEDLFKAYNNYPREWEDFIADEHNDYYKTIEEASEDDDTRFGRRNRFLNHLLARFGENFTDYSIVLFENGETPYRLILDKLRFLRELPVLSSARATAFDYTGTAWDTNNVSGFKQRVSRKLGIYEFTRKSLHKTGEEGFHLVEHILLRPTIRKEPSRASNTHRLLPIFRFHSDGNASTITDGFLVKDPYSFVVTIVFPSGYYTNGNEIIELEKFRNTTFRKYAERVIREELPTHIYANICWLDTSENIIGPENPGDKVVTEVELSGIEAAEFTPSPVSLNIFELVLENWLEAFKKPIKSKTRLKETQNSFIDVLSKCIEHISPPRNGDIIY